MSEEYDLDSSKVYSFKTIFRIFLKTGKKRIIITLLTSIILFVILSAFLMTWFSYRYRSFNDNIETRNPWRKDGFTSFSESSVRTVPFSLGDSYFVNEITSVKNTLNLIAPDIFSNYTAALSTKVYFYENDSLPVHRFNVVTLDNLSYNILSNSLTDGRVPVNTSEVLYYKQNTNVTFTINDTLGIKGIQSTSAYTQNVTVVGTIENVEEVLYTNGLSYDVVEGLIGNGSDNSTEEVFITNYHYFYQILNDFPAYNGRFAFGIDFNYQIIASHIRKIPIYLQNFWGYYDTYFDVEFCQDLFQVLDSFDKEWRIETLRILSCGIPIIIIFSLICVETLKNGSFELESKFKLMKTQGMEFKTISRIILLENIIFSSAGLLIGLLLGFFIGYFIFLGFGSNNFSDYFSLLLEPVIPISLFILFFVFLIGGFLLENTLAKKAVILTPSFYKSKRKGGIRRFISAQEVILLLIGLGFIGIGFTGMALLNNSLGITPVSNYHITLVFWLLAVVGALFILIAVFLSLSRLVILLWRYIGRKAWETKRNYLTLSMKHLSLQSKNYQRAIMIVFILSLGLTPGIIIHHSVNDHVHIEAQLAIGYTDLTIADWTIYSDELRENITALEGIERVTEVSRYPISTYDIFSKSVFFQGYALMLQNVTEFIAVVNEDLYDLTDYTKEEITLLANNSTCFASSKYAKKNKLSFGVDFIPEFLNPDLGLFNVTLIHDFDVFPLMFKDDSNIFTTWFERGDFVVNSETMDALRAAANLNTISFPTSYLLMKTTQDANITRIKEELLNNYDLIAKTKDDAEQEIREEISSFGTTFLVIATLLTVFSVLFYGFITARNIYYQRVRIVESQYQVGAKRNQIIISFTLEFLLIIFLPIMIGMLLTYPLVKFLPPYLLNIQQEHFRFSPWLPWWLVLLLILFGYMIIIGGWLMEMIPLVRSYRPIKQE